MTAAAALLASVAWGVADFLGGLKSRFAPALVVLLLAQISGVLAISIIVGIAANAPPGPSVLWASLAGLFGTVGLVSFYRGMAVGSISVVAPIAAVGAIVPVIFGIATGDDLSELQLLGFALALSGVAAASFERQEGGARLAAGVPWAIAALIGFGGYYVPMHEAAEQDFLWAALVFRCTVAVLAFGAWLVLRPPLSAARGHLGAIAAIGLLDTAGNTLFAAAASLGEISVVSVLATLYPVTTVALAAVVLHERLDRLQLAGVVSALAGVVLIAGGGPSSEALPDPVSNTRNMILTAAQDRDYEALSRLIDPDLFVSDDTVLGWRQLGGKPLETMEVLLELPHQVRETNEGTLYQWPRFGPNSKPGDPTEDERRALRRLGAAILPEVGYTAPRLGILEDGRWWFFVLRAGP